MNAERQLLIAGGVLAGIGTVQTKPAAVLISEVAARVRPRVPEQRRDAVDTVVNALWEEYSDARVRDFVPVFVERDALDQLGSL